MSVFHTYRRCAYYSGTDVTRQIGKVKKYTCHCSKCSGDKELWKEDPILVAKDKILSGRIPCGCSTHHMWSEHQYKILNERNAERFNYEILSYGASPITSSTPIVVRCKKCLYEDKELWEGVTFITDANRIKNGKLSCGCARSPQWTEGQNKIRVKRLCKELGYEFHGWVGEYKKNRTCLDLYNPSTGYRWKSTDINSFMSGIRDPKEGYKRSRKASMKSDEWWIKQFEETGKIEEGSTFKRLTETDKRNYQPYWEFTCGKCKEDIYTKSRLCTGTFKTTGDSLKSGKLPCRCSKSYRWPEKQCELKLQLMCEDEGFEFIGFCEEYRGARTYFEWVCDNGHLIKQTVNGFLGGKRCKKCAYMRNRGAFNGYFPKMWDREDHLYLIRLTFDDGSSCLKCGRTFNLRQREWGNKKKSGAVAVETLAVWRNIHDNVYNTEQDVKNIMYSERLNYYEDTYETKLWQGASECYYVKPDVVELIFSLVEESPLTLVENNT